MISKQYKLLSFLICVWDSSCREGMLGKFLSICKLGLHGHSFHWHLSVQNHFYSHKYIQTSASQENQSKLYCQGHGHQNSSGQVEIMITISTYSYFQIIVILLCTAAHAKHIKHAKLEWSGHAP